MAEKLPNPKKYTPKPYEQMQYPGQLVQIDVKFVPKVCIVGQAEPAQWYQYTFIDEYSRFRYLEAFLNLQHIIDKPIIAKIARFETKFVHLPICASIIFLFKVRLSLLLAF